MYSQNELDEAVAAGALSAEAANALRMHIEGQRSTPTVDEEQFRLLTGFNDIFVSIAAAILLFAVAWIGHQIGQNIGLAIDGDGPSPHGPARGRSDGLGARPVLHGQAADGASLHPAAAGVRRRRLCDRGVRPRPRRRPGRFRQ